MKSKKTAKKAAHQKTPWIQKHIAIVRKFYERSSKLSDRGELRTLRNELILALAKAGRPNVTLPMLERISSNNGLCWGKDLGDVRATDIKVISGYVARSTEFATRKEFLFALMKAIPRFTSSRALCGRMREFGITIPKFASDKNVSVEKKEPQALTTLSDVVGLRSYLLTSIESGALVAPGGIEALFREAGQHFSEEVRKANLTLTLEQFTKFVKELVWTKKTEDSLTDYLRHAHDPLAAIEKWQKSFSHIPLEWVEKKMKWVRGISSAVAPVAMIPGLGGYFDSDNEEDWLKGIADIEIPRSSFMEPHKITLPEGSSCSHLVANGPNLGLVYNRAIEENPLRRKLAEAQYHGVDVVFLTNVFALELIKAGGALMVYRARLSGLNTNLDLLDPDYQAEARRIRKDRPGNEVVYETPMERVVNLFTGLHKIVMKPAGKNADGTPKFEREFTGRLCLVLGYNEELLFNTLTYWVINYLRILKQGKLQSDIKLAERDMAKATKEENEMEYERAHERFLKYRKQHTRSATSSTSAEDTNRFVPKIRSLVLGQLKELVPNIEIIGIGSTHVRLNDKPTITIHIPGHKRVSDTLLGEYASRSGPKIIREMMAKTTYICHSYTIQARDTVREADHDGERDSVQIFVIPILVDGKFMREELRDVVRSTHPIQRVFLHDQFKPGAMRFSYHAPGDIVAHDFWPITRALPTIHLARKGSRTKEAAYPDFGKAPYIYLATATDPHLGGRARQTVWIDELNGALGMFEATAHSMRKSGYLGSEKFGVHMWSCNDDGVQGHNYPTEQQPDSQQIPNMQLEEISRDFRQRMQAASGAERLRIFDEYQKLIHTQVDGRGIDWVQNQMEDLFDRFITPNVDYFSAILLRAKRSGLILKPASEHYGVPKDNRDLGIINWGSGNHFDHSVESMLTEGFLYERDLREKLLQRDEWRGQSALLKKWVRAPLYSNFFCGWGTIKMDGGYEWGMDLRPSPTRMGSWGDTLQGAIRNDPLRGNPTRFMEGKVRIQTYGDKHFFGSAITPDVIFHMCASGTHTDRYGEHGFPPNNTGVSFLGIPVEGPRLPFLFRYLRYEQIAQLVKPGVTFDWGSFLPNPA